MFPEGKNQWLSGRLLAALPTLSDPQFRKSLVFLADHDANGAFGLILNRPFGKTMGGMLKSEESLPDVMKEIPLYQGGPVQPDGVIVAVFEPEGGGMKCNLGGTVKDIERAIKKTDALVRAFVGYSGWQGGQLEVELKTESWKVCKPCEALFDDNILDNLWEMYVGDDDRWQELLPFLPDDPTRN